MRLSLKMAEDYNGVVLWRGKSLLNDEPIVVIATGLRVPSANKKTGAFIQTYILPEREKPTDAIASGLDEAVCGDCIHRKVGGWGTCYVNHGRGPNQVYAAYCRGSYPEFSLDMLDSVFAGRLIRLGSYGDPGSVPVWVWSLICGVSAGWTGYTHQWKSCEEELREYCMASVETVGQQRKAREKGWKTFRVRNVDEGLEEHEFICPASEEGGKRKRCEDCLACHGGKWNGSRVTPVIYVHGTHFKSIRFRGMQKKMRSKKRYRYLDSRFVGLGVSKC